MAKTVAQILTKLNELEVKISDTYRIARLLDKKFEKWERMLEKMM